MRRVKHIRRTSSGHNIANKSRAHKRDINLRGSPNPWVTSTKLVTPSDIYDNKELQSTTSMLQYFLSVSPCVPRICQWLDTNAYPRISKPCNYHFCNMLFLPAHHNYKLYQFTFKRKFLKISNKVDHILN